ncbi:MAG: hypothetical protein V2J25_03590 [Desulfatiglans sp.]|jgi:hypothetical protein|nr:hypothetical protein [Thermodesulfobacteriota bacterium]MEE4351930.1 hypothetical protein [Desulfatiglans sp.]
MKRCDMILLMVLILLFFVPSNGWSQPFGVGSKVQQEKAQHGFLCSSNGRFAFGQISDSSSDQFMLDTLTGRLWKISQTGKVGLFLEPVPYHTGDKEYSPVPKATPHCSFKGAEKK